MKAKDIRQLTPVELKQRAAELRGEIRDLRFNITTRQNSKVRDLRKARKDLARIVTIIAEQETKK
ncbi:50S ribosomal protein L29 [Patescibacteria group bacterium]|nr:50S ribosomal protein L29 [Patescibacteria group bacterium]